MSNLNENRSIFARDTKKTFQAIQKLDDPNTSADEMLSISKLFILILLAYSGLLGAVSYYKNFEPSFGHVSALFMCLALAVSIEIGKSYFGLWAFRTLLIIGPKRFMSSLHEFIKLIALSGFAIATFTMSVINSTRGGEQLSLLLRHERAGYQSFQPNTADYDAQIAQINSQIEANNGNKWKGVVSYESQKMNKRLAASLETIQRQKEATITQQRDDWNKYQQTNTENGDYAAKLVLASGGWVELLQVILLILRVACERSLITRLPQQQNYKVEAPVNPGYTNAPTQPSNFYQFPNNGNVQNTAANNANNRPIGFHKDNTAQTGSNVAAQPPVSRRVTGVTRDDGQNGAISADAAIKHFRTNFLRYAANLKDSSRDRKTTCKNIGDAITGMSDNITAVSREMKQNIFNELERFWTEIHLPLVDSYAVEMDKTPMALYLSQYNILHEYLKESLFNYHQTQK